MYLSHENLICASRAPISLFNVKHGQDIKLEIVQRTQEDYRPPTPKPMEAFGGSGQRLGAPTPEARPGATTSVITNNPSAFGPSGDGTSAGPSQAAFEVDPSKPTTSVQVRTADGSK